MLGQLVDDYLMDFDIFHVSAVSELAHYVETKYLCTELGGSAVTDVDQWLLVQVSLAPPVQSSDITSVFTVRRMLTASQSALPSVLGEWQPSSRY